MLKTTLSTSQYARTSLEDLLLDPQSTLIGPKMLLPREILHNRMIQAPGRTINPVDMEAVQNYVLQKKKKKKTQKHYFNRAQNAKPLPQLDPGHEVFILSPANQWSYVPGIIINRASTTCSYNTEAQGKRYHRSREHIYPIQQDISTSNPTPELEPQTPHTSHIPKPSSPTRAHPHPIKRFSKSHTSLSTNSHIPRLQWQQPSWPNPSPSLSNPTATVNHLLHLATLNDHNPRRQTGNPTAFHTFQCIEDPGNTSLVTDSLAPVKITTTRAKQTHLLIEVSKPVQYPRPSLGQTLPASLFQKHTP